MSDFDDEVSVYTKNVVATLRKWDEDTSAKKVMREFLSENGVVTKSSSKLDELLEERHKLALFSEDENVKLKAIESSLAMASGSEKNVGVTNNQFNFGDFLNKLDE